MIELTINFTSTYALGQYRLCWHIVGSPSPYVCSLVTCTPALGACSAVISTGIIPPDCTDIEFEGYLQPLCEPEESLAARASFSVTYVPCPAEP
jgi:hypothetical protein